MESFENGRSSEKLEVAKQYGLMEESPKNLLGGMKLSSSNQSQPRLVES